jgi:fructose-1-phosphate kinase PfkB-like protein
VPNLATDGTTRNTGGGDRFTAGFAHDLAAGGEVGAAAALGHCCASYHVTRGETGTAAALEALLAGGGATLNDRRPRPRTPWVLAR